MGSGDRKRDGSYPIPKYVMSTKPLKVRSPITGSHEVKKLLVLGQA